MSGVQEQVGHSKTTLETCQCEAKGYCVQIKKVIENNGANFRCPVVRRR